MYRKEEGKSSHEIQMQNDKIQKLTQNKHR
jgi:hypothetical protein